MKSPLTVLVVDADPVFRQKLCTWLISADGALLAGAAESDPEGMVLARERQPDVVLLAVELMPDSGTRKARALDRRYAGSRTLVLSHPGQDSLVLDALRLGAAGYLVREECSPEIVLEAMRTVCRGEAVLSPRMAGLILDEIVGSSGLRNPA